MKPNMVVWEHDLNVRNITSACYCLVGGGDLRGGAEVTASRIKKEKVPLILHSTFNLARLHDICSCPLTSAF